MRTDGRLMVFFYIFPLPGGAERYIQPLILDL